MQLSHIKVETCPTCGARPVSEEKTHQHSNGQWFESRTFACGYRVRWVPNFSSQQEVGKCTQCEEHRKNIEREQRAHDQLVAFIDQLDADQGWKNAVQQRLPYRPTLPVVIDGCKLELLH